MMADSILPVSGQLLDRYSYAGNRPTGFVDPSGHEPVPWEGSVSGTRCTAAHAGIERDWLVTPDPIGDLSITPGMPPFLVPPRFWDRVVNVQNQSRPVAEVSATPKAFVT